MNKNESNDEAVTPDIRDLLAYINHGFGGIQEYAEMLVEDVKAADPGSAPRLTFHNNYLNAIAKFGGNDDLAGMGLEELEEEAKRIENTAPLKPSDEN